MSRCTAVIAALPREVKALVRGWQPHSPAKNIYLWTHANNIVACAGMGAARAILAAEAALAAMPVTHLISAGLAGACNPALKAGDVLYAGIVLDAETDERFDHPESSVRQSNTVLASTGSIVSVREKSRLHADFNVDAVDMEAAAIARIAAHRGLPFRAIKAISDAAEFEIESLARFASSDGQFRTSAFALHAALRPPMWNKVISLARNSTLALSALTRALQGELDL